jgi:hypothetical protein
VGIDPEREACLAVVNLYVAEDAVRETQTESQPDLKPLPGELLNASRTSTAEIQYEPIQAVCAAGKTIKAGEVDNVLDFTVTGSTPEDWFSIGTETFLAEEHGYVESVLKRRSRRNFVPVPLATPRAMYLMQSLCMDSLHGWDEGLVYRGCMNPGFTAVNVEAFDPGTYLLDTRERAYGLVSGGSSGADVARVCLDQAWLKNGSLHFLFMANLPLVDRHLGARGYRYAMLNSGRAAQRIYLAGTSLGLGVCGIGAIYDDEARQLFSLSDESALLYLMAVGPVRKV